MQPWETVDSARVADGTELSLCRRGDEWVVRAGGRTLMSSRQHGSEDALAGLALARVSRPGGARTVLIGGLGLGYTLRATLDRIGPEARAVVAEISPELVAWNRGPLAHLAGSPLDDPRTRLQIGDVVARIAEANGAFDAILLDVDNSPSSMVLAGNDRLYGGKGVKACARALASGGVLAVWSAGPDDPYVEKLERAGLAARAVTVPARGPGGGGARHVIFLGVKEAVSPRRPGRAGPPARSRPAPRRAAPRAAGPSRKR
jgi:predicted membrane-bound spermidine synthase